MKWYGMRFDDPSEKEGVKAHTAPEGLYRDVIADMEQRGFRLDPNARDGTGQPESAVQPVTEYQFDLGGMWIGGEPVRTYRVDSGMAISVPCAQHGELVAQMVTHGGVCRVFPSGMEYLKVYAKWGVLVLSPAMYTLVRRTLELHAASAREASVAFMREWKAAHPLPPGS